LLVSWRHQHGHALDVAEIKVLPQPGSKPIDDLQQVIRIEILVAELIQHDRLRLQAHVRGGDDAAMARMPNP
jgi:hypothetical protein